MTSSGAKRRKLGHVTSDTPKTQKAGLLNTGVGNLDQKDGEERTTEEENENENEDADVNEGDKYHGSRHDSQHETVHRPKQAGLKRPREESDTAPYAGESYKSSLFKLQMDELLSTVLPEGQGRLTHVDDALRRVKTMIESIEHHGPLPVKAAIRVLQDKHRISIPFPEPKPDLDSSYKFMYDPPSKINVVGSYAQGNMVASDTVLKVDMLIVMPPSIFQEKDYLNYRYFYKRSYYLACIAAGLQESFPGNKLLEFDYLNSNDLHPILIMKAETWSSNSESPFEIRIIPSAPPSLFAAPKLRSNKNSIRRNLPSDRDDRSSLSSPFYNASITADLHREFYHNLLHMSTRQSSSFKDACILGKTWLRQRGFNSGLYAGGFGHFEWAVVTALLIGGGGPMDHGLFAAGYSSYQLFKAMLQFISSHDLVEKPFFYKADGVTGAPLSTPTFYDGPRGQNLLYKMTSWSYNLLQDEAKACLVMLNDANFESFEATFITKLTQPLQRFDCIVKIKRGPESIMHLGDHVSGNRQFSTRLHDVLKQGLMDRVRLIHIQEPDFPRWNTKSSSPSSSTEGFLVSISFDTDNVGRLVDHGPVAENKAQAAEFRTFWGDKAELRRFKDGSILESLIWSAGSTYTILNSIVKYVVDRHLGLEVGASLEFIGEGFEKLLPGLATSARQNINIRQPFIIFEKQMRDLEGLPLQLKTVLPSDSQLSSSSVELPLFNSDKPLSTPANILIQFEGSGRWPDDLVAVQRTKIAFLLKIGSLLERLDGVFTTRLGLENETEPLQNCAFLDVMYNSGVSFRIRIHNDREESLLERRIKDKSLDQRSRDEAVSAMSVYKRVFLQVPLLNQSISTLCTRFPMLSPTMRLVKLWFSRHMLSSHVREELIELLVAKIFLQPYPWREPSSVMSGFSRTLLFLSKWNWRTTPLIVNFTGMMMPTEYSSVQTRLEAWRKIDPAMNRTVLFAASNHDASGIVFTAQQPSRMVAARMSALARSACKLIRERGLDLDPKALFSTSITEYDFVIYFSPKIQAKRRGARTENDQYKNLEIQSGSKIDAVGYEPIQYFLHELEHTYGDYVVFFHDKAAGNIITGLWHPNAIAPRPFKVNLSYATKPIERGGAVSEDEVTFDKLTVLAEMARLGGDMISRIKVNR